MTIEQCLEKARIELAAKRDEIMADLHVMLTDRGATTEELADAVKWHAAMLDENIAKQMTRIEGWLRRGGEELH